MHSKQVSVAKHFRVTPAAISTLVKMVSKNPSRLSELISKKRENDTTRAAIKEQIEKMAAKKEIIDSTAAVTAKLNAEGAQQHK